MMGIGTSLKAGAWSGEVLFLRRRVLSAEHRVAMREAAEFANDLTMAIRVIGRLVTEIAAQCLEQADRLILVREILGMFERQVDEDPLDGGERRVEAGGDHAARDVPGVRVGGERLGRTPEHIARQLIEQYDQREPASRG